MSKTALTTITMILSLSIAASAQGNGTQTSTLKRPELSSNSDSTKGFRVSLLRPTIEVESKYSTSGSSGSSKGTMDSTLGLAVGYAYLPAWSPGFTTNLAYLQMQNSGADRHPEYARVDGNFAYTFGRTLNLKAGVNFSKLTNAYTRELGPALGFQFGGGLQLNKHIGIDLSYVKTRQVGKIDSDFGDIDVEYSESGPELAITGTF